MNVHGFNSIRKKMAIYVIPPTGDEYAVTCPIVWTLSVQIKILTHFSQSENQLDQEH